MERHDPSLKWLILLVAAVAVWATLSLATAQVPGSTGPVKDSPAALLTDAAQKMQALDFAGAVVALERALAAAPRDSHITGLLDTAREAAAAQTSGSDEAVQRLLQEAALRRTVVLQMARLEMEDNYQRGVTAHKDGRPEEAIKHLNAARDALVWLQPQTDVGRYPQLADDYLAKARSALAARRQDEEQRREQAAGQIARSEAHRRLNVEHQRIDSLYDRARDQYRAGHYEAAGSLAQAVLDINPAHPGAGRLADQTACRSEIQDAQNLGRTRDDLIRQHTARLDAMTVPQNELVVYPANWDEIQARKVSSYIGFDEEPSAEWRNRIEAALEQKISFEFADSSLDEALRFLSAITGTGIVLDREAVAGREGALSVSLALSNTTLRSALQYIAELTGLAWTLKNEAIFVTTPEKAEGDSVLRIYDVSDLIVGVNDFHVKTTAIVMGDEDEDDDGLLWGRDDDDADKAFTGETLVQFIQRTIRPDSWTADKTIGYSY